LARLASPLRWHRQGGSVALATVRQRTLSHLKLAERRRTTAMVHWRRTVPLAQPWRCSRLCRPTWVRRRPGDRFSMRPLAGLTTAAMAGGGVLNATRAHRCPGRGRHHRQRANVKPIPTKTPILQPAAPRGPALAERHPGTGFRLHDPVPGLASFRREMQRADVSYASSSG